MIRHLAGGWVAMGALAVAAAEMVLTSAGAAEPFHAMNWKSRLPTFCLKAVGSYEAAAGIAAP